MVNALEGAILLCDDDEGFRERLAKSLRKMGSNVFTAPSAEEALTLVKENVIKFAIVDLKMPNVSGLELVSELRAVNDGIKIIVLTGYGSIKSAMAAVSAGACNYLTKPTSVDAIIQAFEGHAQSRSTDIIIPTLEQVEQEYLNRVVDEHGGNISRAAKALGLHRRSLQRKMLR